MFCLAFLLIKTLVLFLETSRVFRAIRKKTYKEVDDDRKDHVRTARPDRGAGPGSNREGRRRDDARHRPGAARHHER